MSELVCAGWIALAFIVGWISRFVLVADRPATTIDNKCADCGTHHAVDCKQVQ